MKSTKGFTIVELLTVIAVSALLLSLLLPSLHRVRNMAREAKQRVQFSAIDQALLAWRNDFGEYPSSFLYDAVAGAYFCGAQKLTEALFGLDLLGYHPDSTLQPDYDFFNYYPSPPSLANLQDRKGRYLELESANAFLLGDQTLSDGFIDGLFANTGSFYSRSYVLCDVFGKIPITVGTENKRAGMPILYYRANTSRRTMMGAKEGRIYWDYDNSDFIYHFFGDEQQLLRDKSERGFYYFIEDPKASQLSGVPWPYRPDSYILISAGLDGVYGTTDDITNFR